MSYSKTLALSGAVVAAMTMSTAADAEVLPVAGIYGSGTDLPPDIEVIATESFGGDLGPDVSIDLSDALGGVTLEGETYFRIVPAVTSGGDRIVIVNTSDDPSAGLEAARAIQDDPNAPDAILRGSVRSEVIEQRSYPKEVSKCYARDDKDKCIDRRKIKVPCRELSVRVDPRILLVASDGRQLYSKNNTLTSAKRFCRDENSVPSANDMIDGLVSQMVRGVRLDLAPQYRAQEFRILESRKGLVKSDRKLFRDAVRLTKNDALGACYAFEALEANNPTHVSVLFNIGLCKEGQGELEAARDYYNRALAVDPSKTEPTLALRRLDSRERGERQMAERFGEVAL